MITIPYLDKLREIRAALELVQAKVLVLTPIPPTPDPDGLGWESAGGPADDGLCDAVDGLLTALAGVLNAPDGYPRNKAWAAYEVQDHADDVARNSWQLSLTEGSDPATLYFYHLGCAAYICALWVGDALALDTAPGTRPDAEGLITMHLQALRLWLDAPGQRYRSPV